MNFANAIHISSSFKSLHVSDCLCNRLLGLPYVSALIAGLESRGLTEPVDNHPCETSKIAIVWICGTSDCTDAPILKGRASRNRLQDGRHIFCLSYHLHPFERSQNHQTRWVKMTKMKLKSLEKRRGSRKKL